MRNKMTLNRRIHRFIRRLSKAKVGTFVGGLTSFFGFIIMEGAAGNSDLNIGTFKENTLMALLGLTFLFVGMAIVAIFDDSDYRESWIEAVGYDIKYNSYIEVVDFKSDRDWFFVLLNSEGRQVSKVIRTCRDINSILWNAEMEEE